MREIRLRPLATRKPYPVIRRLQFFALGAELLAWIGSERSTYEGRVGYTDLFCVHEFASSVTREATAGGGWRSEYWEHSERTPDPPVAPNRGLMVSECGEEG